MSIRVHGENAIIYDRGLESSDGEVDKDLIHYELMVLAKSLDKEIFYDENVALNFEVIQKLLDVKIDKLGIDNSLSYFDNVFEVFDRLSKVESVKMLARYEIGTHEVLLSKYGHYTEEVYEDLLFGELPDPEVAYRIAIIAHKQNKQLFGDIRKGVPLNYLTDQPHYIWLMKVNLALLGWISHLNDYVQPALEKQGDLLSSLYRNMEMIFNEIEVFGLYHMSMDSTKPSFMQSVLLKVTEEFLMNYFDIAYASSDYRKAYHILSWYLNLPNLRNHIASRRILNEEVKQLLESNRVVSVDLENFIKNQHLVREELSAYLNNNHESYTLDWINIHHKGILSRSIRRAKTFEAEQGRIKFDNLLQKSIDRFEIFFHTNKK